MKLTCSQKGSVLIVSLIFLLLLTIVGLSAMNMTSLEERMAGNFRDHDLAFQAAEAALLDAEEFVENTFDITKAYTDSGCSGSACYGSSCAGGLCFNGTFKNSSTPVESCTAGTTKEWEDNSIWSDSSKTRSASDQVTGTVENARFIIEFRCFMPRDPANANPDPDIFAQWSPAFRITALASGSSTDSQVMLQSIYKLVN
ncbi:MAG: pilus assembly PilX family protein [Marinobacter sp.]|uniref:pilus assembly PilX family protein n=1 Tax=Marinobacter sp. TaxID=50741 RepID=UPI003C3D3A4B